MTPVQAQIDADDPQKNRPENYRRVVLRRNRYTRADRINYNVEVELKSDGSVLRIAQMMFEGDAFAYGQKVAKRAKVQFRSYT
jgi:hypothetical protein